MNTEDRLWDYIDGLSTAEERLAIEQLLHSNATIRLKYEELMALHDQLTKMELDEPGMGFKNRVMEQVLAGPHPVSLKTRVDKRIINAIAAFFVITIGSMLIYILSQVNWNAGGSIKLPAFKMPQVNWSFFSGSSFTLFSLSVIVVLALLLIDKMVTARRKEATT